WDVIQLDLVPDAPRPPPLKYPDNPYLQSQLDYAKRFYDTADHLSARGDFDTVEDKDNNVLIFKVGHRPGVVSSAVQIEDIVFAAGIVKNIGKGALKLSKKAYSVAYETVIEATGEGTRAAHFRAANQALLRDMAADPDFARYIEELGIEVKPNGESPADWTWHHVRGRPGNMQLVPYDQHKFGSEFQDLLHPLIGGR